MSARADEFTRSNLSVMEVEMLRDRAENAEAELARLKAPVADAGGRDWDFIRGRVVPADVPAALGSQTITVNGHTHQVQAAGLSDMDVASKVRMLMRDDFDHEAVCTMARDRIVYLSDQLRIALSQVAGAKAEGRNAGLEEAAQAVVGLAAVVDHPSVYMGGPSRQARRVADKFSEAIRSLKSPASAPEGGEAEPDERGKIVAWLRNGGWAQCAWDHRHSLILHVAAAIERGEHLTEKE